MILMLQLVLLFLHYKFVMKQLHVLYTVLYTISIGKEARVPSQCKIKQILSKGKQLHRRSVGQTSRESSSERSLLVIQIGPITRTYRLFYKYLGFLIEILIQLLMIFATIDTIYYSKQFNITIQYFHNPKLILT